MEYWFNTKTGQVESSLDEGRARSADLMGPYASEAEAARALETAREKTEAWDAEDAAEDEWRTGDSQASDWDNNPLNG